VTSRSHERSRRVRPEQFNASFFDRFYRHPRHRVRTPTSLRRQAALAVSAAEWVLERPIRSVLDIGCGECEWRAAVARLRPGIRYVGVDPSPYVLERFRHRGVRPGSFNTLGDLSLNRPFDLVVCVSVAQYLRATELARGLRALAPLVGGVCYLEIFTAADDVEGDVRGRLRRSAPWYRRVLHRAGLRGVGLHLYVGPLARPLLTQMETPG